MNIENSKTNEFHIFRLIPIDKSDLKDTNKNIALVNLGVYYTWQILNLHITTINLRYLLQHGIMNSIYLMDQILYEIFSIILSTSLKSMNRSR